MKPAGWNHTDSPFHPGEQAVQTRLGVREKMENFGRRVIRDYMPDQHREFYYQLPFLLLGMTDRQGRPWASIVVGRPGFITSPDPHHLHIASQPLYGSPLQTLLEVGAEVGILGILPELRRRNRLTGQVSAVESNFFGINIGQAFGNCPQYIQTRTIDVLDTVDQPGLNHPVHRYNLLDPAAQALIQSADTLFIASAYTQDPSAPSQGADVSHRGGKPGFVHIEDEYSFIFPDFSGNLHFNTVGNLVLNPKAGFLFIDFEQRDLLYLTGTTHIIWEGSQLEHFVGAERLIQFQVDEAIRVENSLPLAFRFGEYSPYLEQTGRWEGVTDDKVNIS